MAPCDVTCVVRSGTAAVATEASDSKPDEISNNVLIRIILCCFNLQIIGCASSVVIMLIIVVILVDNPDNSKINKNSWNINNLFVI